LLLLRKLGVNSLLYLQWLAPLSNPVGRSDTGFYRDWSIYYWAWWISWAPFVGMFMARISRGRTVREFMLGALVAPTALSIVWMTIFGDTAIAQAMSGIGRGQQLIAAPLEAKLFLMLEGLPWPQVTCFLSIILILIFFITGWDSGTLVIDCMTAGGREDTPLMQRVIWLLLVGGAAVILLFAGGLDALQTAAIVTGLPLAALLLLICAGTIAALHHLHHCDSATEGAAP
jgi:BCCT family betaine/carnitine transporter